MAQTMMRSILVKRTRRSTLSASWELKRWGTLIRRNHPRVMGAVIHSARRNYRQVSNRVTLHPSIWLVTKTRRSKSISTQMTVAADRTRRWRNSERSKNKCCSKRSSTIYSTSWSQIQLGILTICSSSYIHWMPHATKTRPRVALSECKLINS